MGEDELAETLEKALEPQIPDASSMSDEEIQDEIENLVEQNPLLTPNQTPLSLDEAFVLGSQIEYLTHVVEFEAISDDGNVRGVIEALERMEEVLQYSDFDSAIEEQVKEEVVELRGEDEEDTLPAGYVSSMTERAEQWGNILEAELSSEKRMPISNRGMFDVEAAMENPKELFDSEVWEWLPELPKNDIVEACQCLAVESSTGSMILSLRAVEDCLRQWYVNEIDGDEGVDRTPWGGVLDDLEDHFGDQSRQPAVLTNLDYLRMKRNQVNHPQKSPSWSEAEATLFIVRDTIREIHDEMTSGDRT